MAVTAALGAAGGIMGGIKGLQGAAALKKAAKARAKAATLEIDAFQAESVAREDAVSRNGQALDIQASQVIQESEDQAEDVRLIAKSVRGAVDTGAAASGIAVGSGSVLEAHANNESNVELQAQEALRTGESQAAGISNAADAARREAMGLRQSRAGGVSKIKKGAEAEVKALSDKAHAEKGAAFMKIGGGALKGVTSLFDKNDTSQRVSGLFGGGGGSGGGGLSSLFGG